MAKSNLFAKSRYFLFKVLPQGYRNRLLRWIVATRFKSPQLVFPWKSAAIKKILAILPEEPVEAFHQINNYLRISAHFKHASFVLFCTKEVAPYFKQIHPEAVVIEYDRAVRHLFSSEFDAWGKELGAEEFDFCLMLERSPDISLLYIAGKTAAPVRAGYCSAGDFPFLNMHINPSPKRPYLTDQNAIMAGVFGAPDRIKIHWSVSKETVEEVAHLAREASIAPSARLGLIDVGCFFKTYGASWTQKLCAAVTVNKTITWCVVTTDAPDEALADFIATLGLAVFSNLSAPRCVALLSRSVCVVSGISVIFELAHLLHRPLIGMFEQDLLERYCRKSDTTAAVAYVGKPDQNSIQKIVELTATRDALEK